MGDLLRRPVMHQASEGVTVIHHVTSGNSPLQYVGFTVLDMAAGSDYFERLDDQECCIVALRGMMDVTAGDETFQNVGTRTSVFEQKPTDSVYVSGGREFSIQARTSARIALCYAPSHASRPTKFIPASANGVEWRGILNNRRLVHNILPDTDPSADSLLVVEVFTGPGNWSSYPPHKHDRDNLPDESMLEETYYHEIDPPQGFVFQRVYTDDGAWDETMTVMNGDVVMVPKGYHPVGVPDGYTSYYLNVMAGPKRLWKFYNDPAHAWILHRQPQ